MSLNSKDLQHLSEIEYYVTQDNGTEPPYTGRYVNEFNPGIYADVVDGTPLFLSTQKFPSSCGWPAFSGGLDESMKYRQDLSHNMNRIEVRSALADSHLGHVFNDGPKELGGLRYCINSAALRFIPLEKMEQEGYGKWIPILEKELSRKDSVS